MQSDRFHIIIASNRHGNTLRFSISRSVLKAFHWIAFLLLILTASCFIDYWSLRSERVFFRQTREENRQLRKGIDGLETRYAGKISELTRARSIISKLKFITKWADRAFAGSDNPRILDDSPESSGDLEGVDRIPAATSPLNAKPEDEGEGLFPGDFLTRLDLARHLSEVREQELLVLWESFSNRQTLLAATPTIKPAQGFYSSKFGLRIHPITGKALLHAGVDIAAPYGSLVRAPADGLVSYTGFESGYGNLVSLDHGFGVVTRFAHNSKILVGQGQRVHRGDPISQIGSTGRSTGAHVHYEVRINGFPVDPINYILQED